MHCIHHQKCNITGNMSTTGSNGSPSSGGREGIVKAGYLSKVRAGMLGTSLDSRYFALKEVTPNTEDDSLASLNEVTRESIVGALKYYINDDKSAPIKDLYLLSSFTSYCDAIKFKENKFGFCFIIRGIVDQDSKELMLSAASELDRDAWVSSLNMLIAATVMRQTWFYRQPTAAGSVVQLLPWKRQYGICRSFKKIAKAISINIDTVATAPQSKQNNNQKIGLLTVYMDDTLRETEKQHVQFDLLKNTTHCYSLQNAQDGAIPQELRAHFPFMLCNKVGDTVDKSWIYIVDTKEERAEWIDTINRLLDFKVCYAGNVVKKGSLIESWKKRYLMISSCYVVDGHDSGVHVSGKLVSHLTYYEDDTFDGLRKEKGRIEVTGSHVVEKMRAFDAELPKGVDAFGIILTGIEDNGDKRQLKFFTDSEKERDKIIKELNIIIYGEGGIAPSTPGGVAQKSKSGGGGSTEKLNYKTSTYGGSDSSSNSSVNSNSALKESAAVWKKGGTATRRQSAMTESSSSSSSSGSKQNASALSSAFSTESSPTPPSSSSSASRSNPVPPSPATTTASSVWRRKTDGSDVWFVEVNTGESAWEIPAGGVLYSKASKEKEPDISVTSSSDVNSSSSSSSNSSKSGGFKVDREADTLPEGWFKCISDDGRPYYYNEVMRISRWDPPSAEVAAHIREQELEKQRRVDEALKTMREREQESLSHLDAKSKAQMEMKETVNMVINQWRFKDPNINDPQQFSNYRSLPELLELLPSMCYLISEDVITKGIGSSIELPVIKKQYMKVMRLIHPDKLPSNITFEQRALVEEILLILADSYEIYKSAMEEL